MRISAQFVFIASIIYFILVSIPAWTQASLVQKDSLYSKYLKEQRPVEIFFPKSYKKNSTEKYDVLYVLDGEWNTSLAVTVYGFLEFAKFIPANIIIVSVPNYYRNEVNMRDRDFTPTLAENSDGKINPISGGAGNFLLFLKDELVPFVTKKCQVKIDNSILYGTSSGGLFAIYTYLNEPTLFTSYLTVEPSLWWGNEYINKIAPEKLKNKEGIKNSLWISSRDGGAQVGMGISRFDSLLTQSAPKDLQWKVEAYSNETHFSAIWKGIYDGLKYTYVKSQIDETLLNRANVSWKFRSENGKYISFSKMDTFLRSQMDSIGMPGLSFALISDGQLVYRRTLGVTNVETKHRVSYRTLFDAASMTKTPFAFLVMRLVEKGVLDLDDPLYKYLPYPDIAYDDRYKQITGRMVLSHTTGFPNWRFFNKDGKLDIKFTPGTQYQYSGEGYEYLANVIAHLLNIRKNDLQELFNEEIGKPLGMEATYFTWNSQVEEHRATGHVDGKVADGYGVDAKNPNFYASYSMQTEALNYARFLVGLMNGNGLKKESYDEMLKVQFPNTRKSPNEQWGLGIGIRHTEFGDEFFHGGFNLNFTSEFMINNEQKFGYVFFTNCNKGSDFNKKLLRFIKYSGE
ncbi:serine hydrolase [Chryseolinea sp. H1M3-3]|uniref:serine hydrolase n=1 Tax=Chryseolinea sp. H1M3-3 TaxID=3034144 RepID=UPI0023ED0E6F|nr:serine hydrolase [Chryseolinea sp. H1M3-3]